MSGSTGTRVIVFNKFNSLRQHSRADGDSMDFVSVFGDLAQATLIEHRFTGNAARPLADLYFKHLTLLIVLEGQVHLETLDHRVRLERIEHLSVVAPASRLNLLQIPAEHKRFRAISLQLSEAAGTAALMQCYKLLQSRPPLFTCELRHPPAPLRDWAEALVQRAFPQALASATDSPTPPATFDCRLLRPTETLLGPRLRQLISENPAHPWQAETVSKALAMSQATLHRRLSREQLGFSRLLLEVRMEQGLRLLHHTALSLEEIAIACGYRSDRRYAERFKAYFGLSPAKARKHGLP